MWAIMKLKMYEEIMYVFHVSHWDPICPLQSQLLPSYHSEIAVIPSLHSWL